MHWIGYASDHATGTYRLYNPGTGRVIMSRDVVFLEPKETRKPEKELAVIQEKSLGPTEKKNEAIYVSDSDEEENKKNVHESNTEEENGDTPYLIPPEEQSTSINDETETNVEEQDCSCAFRIPMRSVLAKTTSKIPRRKSPRLSQASYNSARTTRNSK